MTANGRDQSEDTDFHLLGVPSDDESHMLRSREPFELLVSQFVEELRAGRKPSFELYARRFPPHAERIREVFPVLAMLENARIEKEAQSIRRNMPERFPFSRLGNCELLCELGRGGMGVVYQARDLDSGQLVALKILPWRVSVVPEWVARFEQEARTAAQLQHRNIVSVFRYGQENGYCYFVMHFVNGIGLDRVIERLREADGFVYVDEIQRQESERPAGFQKTGVTIHGTSDADSVEKRRKKLTRTSWNNFAKVALQATQALRAAHAAGILHNDIKPGNLLLDADGRVWITDFGLSQSIESSTTENSERTIAGTLRYMAPERLLGQQTAACDLYSLGATLYELCVQRPVFDDPDRDELIRKIKEVEPVRPRDICDDIPPSLEMIILNCLAKHPMDRYASADAMLADVLKLSRDQRVSSTRRRSFLSFFRAVRNALPGRKKTS